MDAKKMRETMEVAHDKELEVIDRKADEAKVAAEEMHQTKMQAFDRIVNAARSATAAVGAKKSAVSETVSEKAADVTETVGMTASDVGVKAAEIKTKATKKAQEMPWLAPMVGVVLLLALALSVGKRMRQPASFDI
jgi:cobalamin biosynthesis Mg chelatase CobN